MSKEKVLAVEDLVQQLGVFYEKETKELAQLVDVQTRPSWLNDPKQAVENSIQRCLGVAEFVQYLGVPYETVNPMHEVTRKKLEKMLK